MSRDFLQVVDSKLVSGYVSYLVNSKRLRFTGWKGVEGCGGYGFVGVLRCAQDDKLKNKQKQRHGGETFTSHSSR